MSAEGISSLLSDCEVGVGSCRLAGFFGVKCCCKVEKAGFWLRSEDCLGSGVLRDEVPGTTVFGTC
jgi:hypothetical protein